MGKEGRSLVLFVPADFDSVEHYGVNCALHKIEVGIIRTLVCLVFFHLAILVYMNI